MKSLPRWAPLVARLWIGLLFFYAGWTKLLEPAANFRGLIAQYEILPYAVIPAIAFVLPWIELIFGAFLIAGYLTRPSALVLSGVSISFVVMLLASYFKTGQFPADCGCFGEGSFIHLTGLQVLALDCANFSLGLAIFRSKNLSFTLDSLFMPKA